MTTGASSVLGANSRRERVDGAAQRLDGDPQRASGSSACSVSRRLVERGDHVGQHGASAAPRRRARAGRRARPRCRRAAPVTLSASISSCTSADAVRERDDDAVVHQLGEPAPRATARPRRTAPRIGSGPISSSASASAGPRPLSSESMPTMRERLAALREHRRGGANAAPRPPAISETSERSGGVVVAIVADGLAEAGDDALDVGRDDGEVGARVGGRDRELEPAAQQRLRRAAPRPRRSARRRRRSSSAATARRSSAPSAALVAEARSAARSSRPCTTSVPLRTPRIHASTSRNPPAPASPAPGPSSPASSDSRDRGPALAQRREQRPTSGPAARSSSGAGSSRSGERRDERVDRLELRGRLLELQRLGDRRPHARERLLDRRDERGRVERLDRVASPCRARPRPARAAAAMSIVVERVAHAVERGERLGEERRRVDRVERARRARRTPRSRAARSAAPGRCSRRTPAPPRSRPAPRRARSASIDATISASSSCSSARVGSRSSA